MVKVKDNGCIAPFSVEIVKILTYGCSQYYAWFKFSPVGDVLCLRVTKRFYEYCYCSGVPTSQWLRYHGKTKTKR